MILRRGGVLGAALALLTLTACSTTDAAFPVVATSAGAPSTVPSTATSAATPTVTPTATPTATSGSPSASPSVSPSAGVTAPPTRATPASPSAAASGSPTGASSPLASAKPPAGAGLGIGASLQGRRPFPTDNPWNTRVDAAPVDPASAALVASIGLGKHLHPDFGANWNGGPFGIPYVVVPGTQPKVAVSFDYAGESDPGPYPIPSNAPIEGGANSDGDRHVLVLDRDHWVLYELYGARRLPNGTWHAGSGAVFRLTSNTLRPKGWTSADAAGLPILPGLVRYDEVAAGRIDHALRFTVSRTRKAFVAPATHYASSNTSASLPPMGMRVRLKASFDVSGYPAHARVVLQALKTYGMIVADNGSDWYLSGAPDKRWDDDALNALKQVPGSAFEVVRMGPLTTSVG